MSILRIEHAIKDFELWSAAFDRFAARRTEGGVLHERIMKPLDDPNYVFIDLEFATVESARRFQTYLETQVWSKPLNSPALEGSPRSRIVEMVAQGLGRTPRRTNEDWS